MTTVNRQFTLAARPIGFPKHSDFKLVESPIPSPGEGEALIKMLWISVDPYMRGRMNAGTSYAPSVEIGGVMVGRTVGSVVESRHPDFSPGDLVTANAGWQEYSTERAKTLRKIDPGLAPISAHLGLLGAPGMTAYFGLLDICDPQSGETAVVSGAAGAVGSLAGQIAKIRGCRVVGTAGTDEKVRYVTEELGFDGAFNYKTVTDYEAKFAELCPSGIDVYFDNVGGALTDAVWMLTNLRARISVCGGISQYNLEKQEMGPRLLSLFNRRRLMMRGFIVSDYIRRWDEGVKQMAEWYRAGKIKIRDSVIEGFENTPEAFFGMLRGENIGKQLVKVAAS